jgi:hypothetical protein
MAYYDQIGFPQSTGLPGTYHGVSMWGPPTLDGFREEEPGLTTLPASYDHQLEAGYTGGDRFSYGGAAGVPVAVVDCIKDAGGDFIYMSFVARYDPSFDDDDFVMVVLRPGGPAASPANDRRIDVQPVFSGGGAKTTPVDVHDYQVGSGLTPEIRTKKDAHLTTFYRRTSGGSHPWEALPGPTPTVTAKVRSVKTSTTNWTVELKIPTTIAAGGASWVDLTSTFGLYFVIGQVFTAGGGYEDVVQYPWPQDPSNPTANFLVDPFGGSLKVDWDPPTLGTATIVPPGGVNPALGVTIYGGYSGIGVLDGGGNVGGVLDMTLGHTNKFVARLQNTSPNTAPKITANFRIAEFGLSGGYWDAAWKEVPATAPSANPAPLGGVDVPTRASVTDYTQVELDWTITAADRTTFGSLGNLDQCIWVELSTVAAPAGGGGAPAAQIVDESVYHNLQVQNLSTAQAHAVIDPVNLDDRHIQNGVHQLILQVTTNQVGVPPSGHTPLEEYLSGVGHQVSKDILATRSTPIEAIPKPAPSVFSRLLGGPTIALRPIGPIEQIPVIKAVPAHEIQAVQENPILSGKVAMSPIRNGGGRPPVPPLRVATWHSVVNGYQLTGKTLTFNGKKRRVLAYAGSYGYLARHILQPGETAAKVAMVHQLTPGPNLQALGRNLYQATVSPKQPLRLANSLRTQPIRTLPAVLAKPTSILTRLGSIFNRTKGVGQ